MLSESFLRQLLNWSPKQQSAKSLMQELSIKNQIQNLKRQKPVDSVIMVREKSKPLSFSTPTNTGLPQINPLQ